MQKSIVKNSIYNTIYTGANILFPFFTSIYVSRILMPAGVGKVSAAQNIVSYFVTLAALGLPSYGVREFSKVREDKAKSNKLFTELFIINMISTSLAAACFLLLLIGNRGFNGNWSLYSVCGISIFLNYINIDWLYQGKEEYGYITARSIMIKTLSFISILLFIKSEQDYIIYALISSLAVGGNHLFNIIHARTFITLDLSSITVKPHIKPIVTIAFIILLSSVYSKIDTTMLSIMADNDSVGYYSYAQKTINIVIAVADAVTAALLPRLSFYYENDKAGFYRLLDKGFQVLCLVAIPLCFGLFLVSAQAVRFLYGEAFAPTALTIRLMCPLILIKSYGNLYCYQLAYSTKNEKIIVPASMAASILNIITNMTLIPLFLQNGAVIASVFSEFATNAMQFAYMKRKIKYRLCKLPLLQSFMTTAVMVVCVTVVGQLRASDPVLLFLEIICGAVVYLVMNILIKNELLMELFRIMKKNIINGE